MKQDTADRVTAQLDRHGWTQGISVNGHGQICAYEAMCRALNHDLAVLDAAERELAHKAMRMFPGRSELADLVTFNDHPHTSEEDVRLVIKRCVED